MGKRKQLSKKTRFEVFKRDKFTCQYCGKSAPDVVLEVDHIVPVAEDGGNDMLNLITSCHECNSGKGAVKLSDDSAIAKQKKQLDMLEDRREQIEMMYEWQSSLIDEMQLKIERIEGMIDKLTAFGLTDDGREMLREYLSKFEFHVVAKATRIAFERYPHSTLDEWEYAFRKIGGICFNLTHKTCSQCVYNDGYDKESHMVKCEFDHDGSYWCKNSYAEQCEYYRSYWKRGGSDA